MLNPFLIAGAVSTGAGLLGKIFGRSPEDERRKRKEELSKALLRAQANVRRLEREALEDVRLLTGGLVSRASQSAARRASALGQVGDVESFVLPASEQASRLGLEQNRVARELFNRAQLSLQEQEVGIERDFANRPIEPSIADYLLTAGGQGISYGLESDYINALRESYGGGGELPSTNVEGGFPQASVTAPSPRGPLTMSTVREVPRPPILGKKRSPFGNIARFFGG